MAPKKLFALVFILGIVPGLIFALGVWMIMDANDSIESNGKRIASSERSVQGLMGGVDFGSEELTIPPSSTGREVLEERLVVLDSEIEAIRRSFPKASEFLDQSVSEFNFLPRVQGFVSRMRAAFRSDAGLLEGGSLRLADPQEGFGFELYLGAASSPRDESLRRRVDTQRQILEIMLKELIASYEGTMGGKFIDVRREGIDTETGQGVTTGRPNVQSGVFSLSDLISARKEGAISTLGFEIIFEGSSAVLRKFMNRMAALEIPIRVASVSVSRATVDKPERTQAAADPLSALFSTPGRDEEATEEINDRPIIESNTSRFSVILEYIEIDLNDPNQGEGGADGESGA
ncbi:MAG: hypothetical protein ACFCU4_04875 [Puniceicoccaceae bacterium]